MFKKENGDFVAWRNVVLGFAFVMLLLLVGMGALMLISNVFHITAMLDYMNAGENNGVGKNLIPMLVIASLQNIAFICGSIAAFKVLKKSPISKMGLSSLKNHYKELGVGLLAGITSMLIVFLCVVLTGNARIVSVQWLPFHKFFAYLVLYIGVGFGEEILCRGLIMSLLRDTKRKYVVLLVPSILFAVLHMGNEGVSPLAILNLALFGIAMSYYYYTFGNIWFPIGFHITWNLCEGNVFGFLVSGCVSNSVIALDVDRSNIFNGGLFGPEGGLFVTVIIIAIIVAIGIFREKDQNHFFEN